MENEQLRSDYLHEPPVYSEISLGDFLHSYDIEVGDIHDSIHLKEQQYLKNITDLRSISIIIIFMYCLSGLTYLLSAKGVPRILILFRFCIAFPVWMIHIFSTFSKKYSYKIGEIVSIICLASLFIGTILIQVHIFNMKYTTLYFDEAISHFYWVSFLSYAFLTVTPLSSRIYITLVFFVFASFSLCAVSKLLKGTLNEVVLFYFATCTLLVNLWVSNELSNLNFRNYALEIKVEQRRNELKEKRNTVKKVLENIIPLPYLPQMSQADQKLDLRGIHKHHNEVAVIVADVVNFTFLSQKVGRILLISLLHELFCRFDILAEKYGLEKVKTVGDWYLCCSGLFDSCPKQNRRENYSMKLKKFESSILMALDMHEEVASLNRTYSNQVSISIRIGIHYGRVISGVIGNSKFQFDVIGEAVSVASMLENSGKEWFVHISKEFEKEISHLKCFSELFIMDGSGFEYQSTKYASVLICRKRWMDDSNNPSLVGIDYHEHVDHLSRCLDIYYIE
jgi:class 3 adenylate cyclase